MARTLGTINISDSMSTIQSKINKYTDIRFQKGVYRITKQLILHADSTIDLNGATLQRCASIQSVFLNKVTKSTTKYNGAGNITIKNGTIEGMGGYSYDNLITFFHANGIEILNCTFRDALCHAIEINSSCNVYIRNCQFLGYNLQGSDYTFRELIQIDYAGAGAFFLNGSSKTSACYDGTVCNNINITDCFFSKSNYRDYPYACIGTHTQIYGGKQHTNINILKNEFHCKKGAKTQACLSFIEMNGVTVKNNKFDCERVARIYSKPESYTLSGYKVNYAKGDGVCSNITISNNTISCSSSEAFKSVASTGVKHTNIVKKPNTYNAVI